MKFEKSLIHGKLIRRYKRFLTDIELDNGKIVTAHCTNSGTMKSCLENNAEVYMTPVNDPKRKTKFTWEMIKINNNWVGINTANPNKLAFEAISKNLVPKLSGYDIVKREVKFEDSRFDIYCENSHDKCFVEVKNVTLKEDNYARFPDAVTTRGRKHLETLIKVKQQGMRAVMLYIIQRIDVDIFAPASAIDPQYAETLEKAYKKGVEIIPIKVKVSPKKIEIINELPFEI
jgi:sugar fermentation stimulation protein A